MNFTDIEKIQILEVLTLLHRKLKELFIFIFINIHMFIYIFTG